MWKLTFEEKQLPIHMCFELLVLAEEPSTPFKKKKKTGNVHPQQLQSDQPELKKNSVIPRLWCVNALVLAGERA